MRYRVTTEGWLDGNYRKLGEIIELSDAEAKWLVRSGQIALADAAPATPPMPKPAPKSEPKSKKAD